MKPLFLYFALFFIGQSVFAQIKPEENKYSYGLKANVTSGKFKFEVDDFYDLKSFEPYLNMGFGAFGQVHFNRIFSMQLELMLHKRDFFSKDKFEKILTDNFGMTRSVFYKVDGSLKIRELGIIANINFINTQNIKYYLCGGGSIGFHPKPEIVQTYQVGNLIQAKNIRAKQPDTNAIIGSGVIIDLSEKMNIFIDFRYYWGNQYFKNGEYGTLTTLRGTIFSLGATRHIVHKTQTINTL
jgi:hypothetical protein